MADKKKKGRFAKSYIEALCRPRRAPRLRIFVDEEHRFVHLSHPQLGPEPHVLRMDRADVDALLAILGAERVEYQLERHRPKRRAR